MSKDVAAIMAEAASKLKLAKEKAAKERDEREAAANLAIAEALLEVDGDERRIIVMRLDPTFGGATVHKMPGEGYYDQFTRRYEASMLKSSGQNATVVTAGLVENKDLLKHPPVSELQRWKEVFPGLYDTIRMTIQDRCGGLDPGKG